MLSRDWGNPDWSSASVRFIIVRLSPFKDVERSTPHQFLFREIRAAIPDAYIDFAFFESRGPGSSRASAGMASARSGSDFDVVMISNSYTLELVNLVPWLKATGLAPTSSSRISAMDGGGPIIVLGGSNAMASSSVYDEERGESIVDAVFFGEGEGTIGTLAVGLADASRTAGESRMAALARLAESVRGFWLCRSQEAVHQAKALDTGYPAVAPPRLDGCEAGTVRLELTKGCPSFCSFCFESWERKPYREHPLDEILAEAKFLKTATGADSVELASYNFNAHSRVVDIIKGLHGVFANVGFQSQRIDILARAPGLLRFEMAAGKRSFTVGVEGVSSRMRAYYAKELSDADLRQVVKAMVERGARELKLFYIISGFETERDLDEFESFAGWLSGVCSAAGPSARVIFSAGPLIRMPFTPLAHERIVLEKPRFESIAGRLATTVEAAGFEYREPGHFDEYCLSQILALPPRPCLELLLALASEGHVYEGALSRGAWDFAKSWLDARGAIDNEYLGEKPISYRFPYSFVEPIVSRAVMFRRFLDAKVCIETAPCLGGACGACGACDDNERVSIENHVLDSANERDAVEVEALVASKRKPFSLMVRGCVPEGGSSADPSYLVAAFLRDAYRALPGLAEVVWTAKDRFLKTDEGLARFPNAFGDTIYELISSRPLDTSELEAARLEPIATESPRSIEIAAWCKPASVRDLSKLLSEFLNERGITHTLSKSGKGASFAVSAKGQKKKNVLSASISESGPDTDVSSMNSRIDHTDRPERSGWAVASIIGGPKCDLAGFATAARKRGMAFQLKVELTVEPRVSG